MQRFTLTADHIKLLRRANVAWEDAEFGAPCIDPKRPYGNSDVLADVAEILGQDEKEKRCPHCGVALTLAEEELLCATHKATETALQVVLATGSFTPGEYVADDYRTNWRRKE